MVYQIVSFAMTSSDPWAMTRVSRSWYLSKANISRRCNLETKLLWATNRKPQAGYLVCVSYCTYLTCSVMCRWCTVSRWYPRIPSLLLQLCSVCAEYYSIMSRGLSCLLW